MKRLLLGLLVFAGCQDTQVAGTTDETETGKPVAGRVLDVDGIGVPADLVAVADSGRQELARFKAGPDGRWTLPSDVPAQSVVARWNPDRNQVGWGTGGDIRLVSAARIHGKALASSPVASCRIQGTPLSARPDAEGRWSLPSAPAGIALRVTCEGSGTTATQVVKPLRPDADSSLGNLLLPTASWDGRPVVEFPLGKMPDTVFSRSTVLRYPAKTSDGIRIQTVKVALETAKPGALVQPEGSASFRIPPGTWGVFLPTTDIDGDGFLTLILDPLDSTGPLPMQLDLIP